MLHSVFEKNSICKFNQEIHYCQRTPSVSMFKNGDLNTSSWMVLLKSGLLGASRAIIILPFQHPFDTIKTNMQSLQKSVTETIKQINMQKGWKGLYSGFNVNLVRVATKQLYRWPLWIGFSGFYNDLLGNANEVYKQTLIGCTIAFAELVFICPFERMKIWLMTTKTKEQTKVLNYFKLHSTFLELYAGFIPLFFRQGLSWASFLAASESFQNIAKEYKGSDRLTPSELFLVSIPVSLVNTFFIMPADCIKTFYQQYKSDSKGWKVAEITKQAFQKYGIRGLYRGWSMRIFQYSINSVFTLVLIEELKREYEKARRG